MSLIQHSHPSDDELGPAAKRRKVNTCLQCKSRKVKCDKVRPHCGPCQRRRIPVDECVFADEADPETLEHYLGPEYLANQGFDMMDGGVAESGSALMGLDDPQARAVLDRITREMRLREAATEANGITTNTDPTDLANTAPTSTASTIVDPQLSQAILSPPNNAAADDLKPSSQAAPSQASSLPLPVKPTPENTKLILGLLPNDHVVNVLLDSLRTFESKSPLGISWRLIRIQLINLRGDISDWRTGQVQQPDVDLTFLALLFELMVSAIDCKPIDEIISEGIALTGDQVPEMTDRWHSTCVTLLSMCNSDTEPNLNTVCTTFLFYLYKTRRGDIKNAVHHLQRSFRSAQAINMHQLDSASSDAVRWLQSPEEQDTTIRTGAVTAMRKALFEGGEAFVVSEEEKLLQSLRLLSGNKIKNRSLLHTNIPDRSHLVREAARTLWVSLTWHLECITLPPPLADRLDVTNWTTVLGSTDEVHLSDGETPELPNSPGLASISTHFFNLLATSTLFSIKHKKLLEKNDASSRLPLILSEWNEAAGQHLAQMREQVQVGRVMLNHFSLLIYHWTCIRVLRPYFGLLEEDAALAGSRAILVTSCREALLQVQKITATSDIDLSVFQPVVTLVKVDATLMLSLHLLAQSSSREFSSSTEWHQMRGLITSSLLLIWTHSSQATSTRLSSSQSWRKRARQLIEHVLVEAFSRKKAALDQHPKVKNEVDEMSEPIASDQVDHLDQSIGPLSDDDPLRVYKDELLSEDPIYRHALFFDALDGKYFMACNHSRHHN